jgi:hypothetical protein
MTKVYVAGPMSGIPQFNCGAFLEAAAALRGLGYDVVLPVDLEDEDSVLQLMESKDGNPAGAPNGETWGDFLAKDVKMLADGVVDVVATNAKDERGDPVEDLIRIPINGIVLLSGWENSRGAKLEAFVGILCKKDFYVYCPVDRTVIPVAVSFIKHQIAQTWAEDLAIHAPLHR